MRGKSTRVETLKLEIEGVEEELQHQREQLMFDGRTRDAVSVRDAKRRLGKLQQVLARKKKSLEGLK